jgi:hypothetical protein
MVRFDLHPDDMDVYEFSVIDVWGLIEVCPDRVHDEGLYLGGWDPADGSSLASLALNKSG